MKITSLLLALTAALTSSPGGRAASNQTLVVVNKVGDTLAFFDPSTTARLATIPLPPKPHEIIVAPDGRLAYVSIYGDGVYGRNEHPGHTLVIVDLQRQEKVGEIDVSPFRAPHGMAFDRTGRLWVSCDTSGVVVIVDTAARKVVGSIPTGTTGNHWLVMLPDGSKVYTSNKQFTHLSVIDVASMKMVGTIDMPHGSQGLTSSRDGSKLYVTALEDAAMHVVDTAMDRVIATVALNSRPMRITLTPDEKLALVSSSSAATVEVVDTASLTLKGVIPVGKGPMGFAFPGNGHTAFVTNHNDGTISVIDPDRLSVLSTFSSDAGPETMVFVEQRSKPADLSDAEQAVLDADRALMDALRKADKAATGALLDQSFTWTDREGKIRATTQVLQDLALATGSDRDTDVRVRSYGELAIVTGTRRIAAQNVDVRFLRVWIKRPAGWRAIVHQGNAIVSTAAVPSVAGGPPPDGCENPCRTIPYTPKTAAEGDILASYQSLETAVSVHDATVWAPHFADEFVVIGRDGHATTKTERIDAINKQEETRAHTNPGPLRSMQIWVVGDAAVMTSDHVTSGAKPTPYHVTRIWVKRDGRWQMAYGQQTTIEKTNQSTP